MNNLERFTRAYVEALYFTDTGDNEQPPADSRLTFDALDDIRADCRSFWRRFGAYITTENCRNYCNGDPVELAGRDFHYTRNGHGVGFWELDRWPPAYSDLLTKGAQGYGELTVYLTDDGMIAVQ